jgi:hypothetical protein
MVVHRKRLEPRMKSTVVKSTVVMTTVVKSTVVMTTVVKTTVVAFVLCSAALAHAQSEEALAGLTAEQSTRYREAERTTQARFASALSARGLAPITDARRASREQLHLEAPSRPMLGDVIALPDRAMAVVYDAQPCADANARPFATLVPVLVRAADGRVYLAVPELRARGPRIRTGLCPPFACVGGAPQPYEEARHYVLAAGTIYAGVVRVRVDDARPRVEWRHDCPGPG